MAMASLRLLLQPFNCLSSTIPFSLTHSPSIPYSTSFKPFLSKRSDLPKSLTVPFALTNSDSAKPLELNPKSLFQELSNCFDLPSDYFQQLPRDLRLDLNDAAFDLSNGPVIDEAWERADASTSYSLVGRLPELEVALTENARSAFGKRLITAGRRFQGMGQYGQGELQKIAKAMISTGQALSATSSSASTDEKPKAESARMFKFGELQVAVTPGGASIGAVIAFVFGILSWQIGQGIQSTPESSLEYANDNALLLAKSLRGSLLALFYSSSVLSFFTTIGLLLLARRLSSEKE